MFRPRRQRPKKRCRTDWEKNGDGSGTEGVVCAFIDEKARKWLQLPWRAHNYFHISGNRLRKHVLKENIQGHAFYYIKNLHNINNCF